MHTLTWKHTRKSTDMVVRGDFGQLWMRVLFVRAVHPNWPMFLDGKPV